MLLSDAILDLGRLAGLMRTLAETARDVQGRLENDSAEKVEEVIAQMHALADELDRLDDHSP